MTTIVSKLPVARLPFEVIGQIVNFNKISLAHLLLFKNRSYRDVAFCGLENAIAELLVKNCIAKKIPLQSTALQREIAKSVTRLNLDGLKMTNEQLQKVLELFPHVKELSLGKHDLTTFDFQLFGQLADLEELNLSNTTFVQTALSKLPNTLLRLFLNDCQLTDERLREIGHLQKLESLGVSNNFELRGTCFSDLPASLLTFFCVGCDIRDDSLPHLGRQQKLQNLNLNHNPTLSAFSFSSLPDTLEKFSCASCPRISETNVAELLKQLMRQNRLSSRWLIGFSQSITVKALDLTHCTYLSPALIRTVATLFPKVEKLVFNYAGDNFTDEHVQELAHFKQLRTLDISYNCKVRGATLSHLPKSLTELNISFCSLQDEHVAQLQERTLHHLDLSGNFYLTTYAFTFISARRVTYGHVAKDWTDESLQKLLQIQLEKGMTIEGISYEGIKCFSVADRPVSLEQLQLLQRLVPDLKELTLKACQLSDQHINLLADFRKLKRLTIDGNPNISGRTFFNLPDKLQRLSATSCGLTDSSIVPLETKICLTHLDVSHNKEIFGNTFALLPAEINVVADHCSLEPALLIRYCLDTARKQGVPLCKMQQLTTLQTTRLDVSHYPLKLEELKDLLELFPEIEHLCLISCNLTLEHAAHFASLKNLQSLDVRKNGLTIPKALLPPSLIMLNQYYLADGDGKNLWQIAKYEPSFEQQIKWYEKAVEEGRSTFNFFRGDFCAAFVNQFRNKDLRAISADELVCLVPNIQRLVLNPEECMLEILQILENRPWHEDEGTHLVRLSTFFKDFPPELKQSKKLKAYIEDWAILKWLVMRGHASNLDRWQAIKETLF